MKGRMLRYALTALVAALAVWGVVAVHNWNARRAKVAERRAELVRLGLPGDGTSDFVPLPAILPHNAAAARIGADLFTDKRLARASRRTCASCHWLNMGGTDGKMHAGRLTPIYALTEGLTNKQFRQFMYEALQSQTLTDTPEKACAVLKEIEKASGLDIGYIVNNSNIGPETVVDDIESSGAYADELCGMSGLPLLFTSYMTDLPPKVRGDILKLKNKTKILF